MDERLVAIPERHRQAAQEERPADAKEAAADDDRRFTRLVGYYWIAIILLLGAVVILAFMDVIATRRYWMARYRELQADHQSRLRRDLVVFRQRRSRFQRLRSQGSDPPPPDDASATD